MQVVFVFLRDFLICLVMIGWKDVIKEGVLDLSCLLNCLRVARSVTGSVTGTGTGTMLCHCSTYHENVPIKLTL